MITIHCWCCDKEMPLLKFVQRMDGRFWCEACHYDWVGYYFETNRILTKPLMRKSQGEFAAKIAREREARKDPASNPVHKGDP